MSDTPLLDKLKRLVDIDQAVSFDNQNPDIYRRRAAALQELGLNSLTIYDYRIWYNSVTLFRQDLDYKWQLVLTRVTDSLNHFLNDE